MSGDVNRWQFGAGILTVLFVAALLLLDVIESGAAAGFGFIGIALMAASGKKSD